MKHTTKSTTAQRPRRHRQRGGSRAHTVQHRRRVHQGKRLGQRSGKTGPKESRLGTNRRRKRLQAGKVATWLSIASHGRGRLPAALALDLFRLHSQDRVVGRPSVPKLMRHERGDRSLTHRHIDESKEASGGRPEEKVLRVSVGGHRHQKRRQAGSFDHLSHHDGVIHVAVLRRHHTRARE